ncbi:MAG: hypothetical protein PUD35_08705, partial [Bacteroidales bacterium]|nr:hypothetical protein [Bacteroidales bacterium]
KYIRRTHVNLICGVAIFVGYDRCTSIGSARNDENDKDTYEVSGIRWNNSKGKGICISKGRKQLKNKI